MASSFLLCYNLYMTSLRVAIKTAGTGSPLNEGYGYAKYNIKKSLIALGYEIVDPWDNPDIQINFQRPQFFDKTSDAYFIGYTPWESYDIPKEWKEHISICDEMWTTSSWCVSNFKNAGYEDIKRYPHGIDESWTPKQREISGAIKFLHIGEPEGRKGGQQTLDAFEELFANDPKYHLTIKANGGTDLVAKSNNVKIISTSYSQDKLIKLVHDHDVLVYPSYGEGFGLIPLQALATGMPVISTFEWSDYSDLLGPLSIGSDKVESPWPDKHPGILMSPRVEELKKQMLEVINRFEYYSEYYFNQSEEVHVRYNWLSITKTMFDQVLENMRNK